MNRNDIKAFGLIAAMTAAIAVSQPSLAAPGDPPAAVGQITVNAPRMGSVMHLRGMAGRGVAVMRLSGNRGCAQMKLRFVAGDFGGQGQDDWGAPVRLEIRSSAIVSDLMRGIEVISDEVRVSTDPNDPMAEIVIKSGLAADTGFVINPGTSPIRNWFRSPGRRVPCLMMQASVLRAEG